VKVRRSTTQNIAEDYTVQHGTRSSLKYTTVKHCMHTPEYCTAQSGMGMIAGREAPLLHCTEWRGHDCREGSATTALHRVAWA